MDIAYVAFFSAFAMNSLLSLGFGLGFLTRRSPAGLAEALVPSLSSFIAGIVVYPLFTFVLSPFSLGYLENFLLLPIVALTCVLVDFGVGSVIGGGRRIGDQAALSGFDGIVYASSYMVLRLSSGYGEAAAFSAGAALGFLVCAAVLAAVRERSEAEAIPRCLRGTPLLILASGLFALCTVFIASAAYTAFGGR